MFNFISDSNHFVASNFEIGPLRHQVQQDQVGQEEWQVARALPRQARWSRQMR